MLSFVVRASFIAGGEGERQDVIGHPSHDPLANEVSTRSPSFSSLLRILTSDDAGKFDDVYVCMDM